MKLNPDAVKQGIDGINGNFKAAVDDLLDAKDEVSGGANVDVDTLNNALHFAETGVSMLKRLIQQAR